MVATISRMKSVLVIEDDPSLRDGVVSALEYKGFQAVGASNGATGLKMIAERVPDLIIADITMPEVDGYGVLKAIRLNPETRTVPFIFITARNQLSEMRQAMTMGADDYLPKPFSVAQLVEAINALFRKREALHEEQTSTLKLLRQRITYSLPHEMRTPLYLMSGNAQLLATYLDNLSREEIKQIAETQLEAADRLQRMIENYLAYAQLEIIATDIEMTEALRNHITANSDQIITKQASKTAAKHDRKTDLQLDLMRLALRISEDNLQKITLELVDNALKFSEPGTPIKLQSSRTEKAFFLRVMDRGRGMSHDEVNSIGAYMQFKREMFEQQGLGLGLALVQRLVELHGGRVDIKSEPKRGTQITVMLPM